MDCSTGAPAAWAREWARRYPDDPEAQIRAAGIVAGRRIERIRQADAATEGRCRRGTSRSGKALCRLGFEDYISRPELPRRSGAAPPCLQKFSSVMEKYPERKGSRTASVARPAGIRSGPVRRVGVQPARRRFACFEAQPGARERSDRRRAGICASPCSRWANAGARWRFAEGPLWLPFGDELKVRLMNARIRRRAS